MRFYLYLLAGLILPILTSCIHDQEALNPYLPEQGASLVVLHPSDEGKNHDDPWDTITEKYWLESRHTVKNDGHDDPWDTIERSFPVGSHHTGRVKSVTFNGFPRVSTFFVAHTQHPNTAGRATIIEIRDDIALLRFGDDVYQFAVDVPATWAAGMMLEVTYHPFPITSKKEVIRGASTWRVIP